MPQISVIVPVYGVEKYLQKCVDSILAQTFTDFELLLVDDGGNDSSGSICDEYLLADARAITIHQSNKGLSGARNTGIDLAEATSSSEWITFIDSDDWVHFQILEILLNVSLLSKTKVVLCRLDWTRNESVKMQSFDQRDYCFESCNPDDAYSKDYEIMVSCGRLYDKTLFRNVRFPLGKYCEDRFTTYKLICQCDRIALVNQELYYYYQSPNSIMRKSWSTHNLDDFSAMYEQLEFFRKNNFRKARQRIQSDFICRLYWQIIDIRECDGLYAEYEKILLQELRKRLFFNGSKCGYHIGTHTEMFYMAYKIPTKAYLKIKRLVEIIKHK